MSMKTCFRCGECKPLMEFYPHPQMADGHLNKCKPCARKDVRDHRAANVDAYRARERARQTPERRARAAEIIGRWKAENPERRAAQVAVGNAIRSGRLTPLPCWICGEKAEAHHPDYSQPLDVVWLCPLHHKRAHAMVA